MKTILKILTYCLVLIVVIAMAIVFMFFPREYGIVDNAKPEDSQYIRVMSYNIKNSYQDYEGWLKRREEIVNLINDYQPLLTGMQEVDNDWLAYLTEELEGYSY